MTVLAGALHTFAGTYLSTTFAASSVACMLTLCTASQVNRSTSQVDCQVTGLALDELELASLRGTVQDAALHVNFDTRMGRGNLKVAGPRFSGLQVSRSHRHETPVGSHLSSTLWNPLSASNQARCHASVIQPQGEALAGSFRWERDVIRLEKVKLEQKRSTYEVI